MQTLSPNTRLPNFLRDLINRALEAVRRNDAAVERHDRGASGRMCATQFAASELERADHGLAAFLGKRRIYHPQPTFLHVPKLPEYEFYARADFPWLAEFEAAHRRDPRRVRTRAARGSAATSSRTSTIPEGVPIDQWAELNKSRRWSAFFLWRDGVRIDAQCRSLSQDRSVAREGARWPTFRDTRPRRSFPYSTASRTFRRTPASRTPASSCICRWWCPRNAVSASGSETREWREAEAWVFDDTIEHEAWNDSDVPRAILIFDTWHPALTRGERELIRTAVPAIKDYYRDEVSISGSEG